MTPDQVISIVESKAAYLRHQHDLVQIFEGNLDQYVIDELRKQLSPQQFVQACYRMAPINILPKLIDKLTNIYQTGVVREVVDGSETDGEMLEWYQKKMCFNDYMNNANEMFNLGKAALIQPYVNKGTPQLRVHKNDQYVVYSDDPMTPNKPTHVIILAGKMNGLDIFWTWSANQFLISDSAGKVRTDLMARYENVDGINPVGRLPFIYTNESKYNLCPILDTDTLKMVKVIPVMLSDLNLAAMYQSFSIIYGIDLDDENLKFAPNAFWKLKSDATSDKRPEIGTIKPTVDFDQVLGLIEAQISMWLGTKGIRSSSVGSLNTKDSYSSGISKIIDEMDTFEARQKQVTVFEKAEEDLWDLILNHMHPHWSDAGMIDNPARWTSTATVKTKFAVQLPMQSRGELVKALREERAGGFTTTRRCIMKLNPEMTDAEIEELEKEIEDERGTIIDATESNPGDPEGSNAETEAYAS